MKLHRKNNKNKKILISVLTPLSGAILIGSGIGIGLAIKHNNENDNSPPLELHH